MFLQRLSLFNFKNHAQFEFRFDRKFICLVGNNGVGKTNILDAIYYLSVTKSHFNYLDAQLIKHGEDYFRLEADYQNKLEIICKYTKNKKVFEKNRSAYAKLSEHFGTIPIVMASPNDILLIIGGSEERRKFIDYTLSSIDSTYMETLSAYNSFLEQRNALLRLSNEGRVDDGLLSIYNEKLHAYGHVIFERRKAFMAEFEIEFTKIYQIISDDKEEVRLDYDSDLEGASLNQLLRESKGKDLALQRTTVGIHKDNIQFITNDFSTKKFGSQGQQKSFLYALRIAQHQIIQKYVGTSPILIIDDLFDKLDWMRGKNLLALLKNTTLFSQIFISDIHKERIMEEFDEGEITVIEL